MRVTSFILMSALAVSAVAAPPRGGFTRVRTAAAQRLAVTGYGLPENRASMWIWSDKYVYTAGSDTLSLRWTVKTNNDLYPYTIVAYRLNNQTGVKTYLKNGTTAATDIYGNAAADGFQPVQLTAVTKGVLAGTGGLLGGAVAIPNEPGMHTIVVQLRDYTGTRVLKAKYMKIGVVTATTEVSGEITADTTWTNDKVWLLKGVVTVKNNATLTINPGTFVMGTPGSQPPSVLLVTQNGKINASGTKTSPIIMTSNQPFGSRTQGDWGGLIMLGKAPINVGANTSGGICGTSGCNNAAGTFYIEGLVANPDGLYGGSDPTWNCGTLKYVRVEYAGSILSPNNETNSFTFGGCGSGTTAEHLQAIYGKDDSFEWFGGTMNAKYMVGGLGRDDYTDFQLGYTGKLQFGLFYQSPDSPGNRGIEGDNSEYDNAALPYSNPTIYNMTYIGSGVQGFDEPNAPGIFLRRGSRGSFNNIVVSNFYSSGIEVTDANTQAQVTAGNLNMNGILMWNNNIGTTGAATLAGQIANAPTLGFAQSGPFANVSVANPVLARPAEYSDPDFRGLFASPIFRAGYVSAPDDGFFDTSVNFIGGIGDEDWTEEWTSFLVESDITP